MLLKVGTQVSNTLKITLTKFHQHLSCGSQVFKGWDKQTNGLLHDQRYVIVLDVNWSSRTKSVPSARTNKSYMPNRAPIHEFTPHAKLDTFGCLNFLTDSFLKRNCSESKNSIEHQYKIYDYVQELLHWYCKDKRISHSSQRLSLSPETNRRPVAKRSWNSACRRRKMIFCGIPPSLWEPEDPRSPSSESSSIPPRRS